MSHPLRWRQVTINWLSRVVAPLLTSQISVQIEPNAAS
jgi:hypothetical protein